MRELREWLARLLLRVGLAREVYHVDAGSPLHVTGEVVDAAGAPLADVEAYVERAALGRETVPALFGAGRSGPTGLIDDMSAVYWAYQTEQIGPPPPPAAEILLRKPGFLDLRIPFDLLALPEVQDVPQLTLGRVTLRR